MKNHQLAMAYLNQAAEILHEVEEARQRRVWNWSVRRSQEVVELSLKAALRLAGIEVPHLHDVGVLLKEHRQKFPPAFEQEIERMLSISRRLRREREISFYGDEELGLPPQELYTEEDAHLAWDEARYVFQTCQKLISG